MLGDYIVVGCPFGCGAKLRFPKADRNLYVTCPRCGKTFTWTPFGIVWDDRFKATKYTRLSPFVHRVARNRSLVGVLMIFLFASVAVYLQFTRQSTEGNSGSTQIANITPSDNVTAPIEGNTPSNSREARQSPMMRTPKPQFHPRMEDGRPQLNLGQLLTGATNQAEATRPDEIEPGIPLRQPRRLPNGAHIERPRLTGGKSTLRIENGTAWDAAVKLIKQRNGVNITARFVYVRRGESAILTEIEPGDYILAWCCGADWDQASKRFTRSLGCFVGDSPFVFTEEVLEEYGERRFFYTEGRVTLHEVFGGNLRKSGITQEEFDRL
jgi:hypothetical protein